MPKESTLTIRLDADMKNQASAIAKGLGSDLSSAVRMFIAQMVLRNSIPLDLTYPQPNAETLESMEEIEAEIKLTNGRRFVDIEDTFEELGI